MIRLLPQQPLLLLQALHFRSFLQSLTWGAFTSSTDGVDVRDQCLR